MYSTTLFKRGRSTFTDLLFRTRTLTLTRHMGGGPRTFPGGLNKWQWKRLHEKRAREKEKRLLDQEKQLYQARIRSDIRANLATKPDPNNPSSITTSPSSGYNPMSPKDHIKVLADRFMKQGAEDLWNENDGPLKEPSTQQQVVGLNQRSGSISSPVNLRKLMAESNQGENFGNGFNFNQGRSYSVKALAVRSESKGKNVYFKGGSVSGGEKKVRRPRRFGRNESSSSDDDFEDEEDGFGFDSGRGGKRVSEIGSRAALGKYDVKVTKRVPLKNMENEIDFEKEIEMLRIELGKKKMAGNGDKVVEEPIFTEKRFDECGISPLTVKALTASGYVKMTRVQDATLSAALEGNDALVKGKTGTGKSIAFLLPAIEAVLKARSGNYNPRVPPVFVLILCPTRELASQLAAEASAILRYHDGVGVQMLIGGTRFKVDQKRLNSDPCQIIVATPGRLLDHIENKGGLSVRLMGLKMLILDEADHLLDLGFRKDVEHIVDCLPRQRQSLLFSATIPKEVRRIAQLVLKRDHAYIDTVGLGHVETPVQVKQYFVVAPHEMHFKVMHHFLKQHILETPEYKVMVFCTTGMLASLMYLFLRELKMNVREMHSRKPQLYRTRISDEFKESKRVILVTSDVSSRGMHYPDVTLVIQVGIPPDREQYIHRLGRTGREGKSGEGILLIAPWEEYFLNELKDLPLEQIPSPQIDPEMEIKTKDTMSKIDTSAKEAAYHAWLGYYNSLREIGRDKTTLVEMANKFCQSIGLEKPPALFRKTALKMGLKEIAGIRIRS